MSFVLDTDICSAYMRGNGKTFNKFIQHGGVLYVSTITLTELLSWVYRANAPMKRSGALADLLAVVEVIPLDHALADFAGRLRASLMDQGINVPLPDFLNGAIALFHNYTLVTHNVQDYTLIPNLRIDDWLL
jgi:tRNA(fMet)-specific endonuclease VapC